MAAVPVWAAAVGLILGVLQILVLLAGAPWVISKITTQMTYLNTTIGEMSKLLERLDTRQRRLEHRIIRIETTQGFKGDPPGMESDGG